MEEARAEGFGILAASSMSKDQAGLRVLDSVRKGRIGYANAGAFTDIYGNRLIDKLFDPNKIGEAGRDTLAGLGNFSAELSFFNAMKDSTILSQNPAVHAQVMEGLSSVSSFPEGGAFKASRGMMGNIRSRIASEARQLPVRERAAYKTGSLYKMFAKSKLSGGMSSGTLENIINASMDAAKVMR